MTAYQAEIHAMVRQYFRCFHEGDWQALAELLHPEFLEVQRQFQIAMVEKLIAEGNELETNEFLQAHRVTSIEGFKALDAKTLYIRTLAINPTLNGTDRVQKNMSMHLGHIHISEELPELLIVVVEVTAMVGNINRAGKTMFFLAQDDGKWKVARLAKDRNFNPEP